MPTASAAIVASPETTILLRKYNAKGLCSNTARKFEKVGGLGMKTGGYDKLSISFFSDNESIQRKTDTAGVIITSTARANPILLSQRLVTDCCSRAEPASKGVVGGGDPLAALSLRTRRRTVWKFSDNLLWRFRRSERCTETLHARAGPRPHRFAHCCRSRVRFECVRAKPAAR